MKKILCLSLLMSLAACSSDKTDQKAESLAVSTPQIEASVERLQPDSFVTSEKPLIVYSARKEHLIKPLFDRYTEISGQKIEYVTDNAGPLLARLKAEGTSSPADILLTVDVGNLWHAAESGVLKPFDSQILKQTVAENLRDPRDMWYGLTVRARTLVYSTERVDAAELDSYQQLADATWNKRLCLRTSKKVYNQSLVSSLIAAHGVEKAEMIVKGWVENLALAPFSNDTKALEAVAAGQCDVTIVNTYYFGRLMQEKPELALKLFWANQNDRGVHINISGAGITAASKQADVAQSLIEWLAGEEAQTMLAGMNMEYPVNAKVSASEDVLAWGDFKADAINLSKMASLQTEAVKLMDRAGYR